MSHLTIWSPKLGRKVICTSNEVTWLDRSLLSANTDQSLHRSPRCSGLRYIDHRWELFSHDTTYKVYIARCANGRIVSYQDVQDRAYRVLQIASQQFEPVAVAIEPGDWLISVSHWVLQVSVAPSQDWNVRTAAAADPNGTQTTVTPHSEAASGAYAIYSGEAPPLPNAVASVRAYFERKSIALMAMTYYYSEFIKNRYEHDIGRAIDPQTIPMMQVAIALNLNSDGSVSEYKKELQRLIWNASGHQRYLAEFLLNNALITPDHLERAEALVRANERSGLTEKAKERLQYRPHR